MKIVEKPTYGDVLWGNDLETLRSTCSAQQNKELATAAMSFYRDGYLKVESAIAGSIIDKAKESYLKWCDENQESKKGIRTDARNPRVVNLHSECDEIKRLLTQSEHLLSILDFLFGYKMSIYTSLTFDHGTEQPLHRDTPVFRTAPEEFYFGVWVALEDANENNGCLKALKFGHKCGVIDQYEFMRENFPEIVNIPAGAKGIWPIYQNRVTEKCFEEGAELVSISAKAGDVVIWHPQLPHGGGKILNPSKTRKSVVFHVTPEGTPVYQAGVFFDKKRKYESCDTKRQNYEFEGRNFMRTLPASFGNN